MSSSQRNWRCSATDKAANYLGLMRKAGRIALGEHDAGAAARAGKACLLLLAQDASDNARKRAEGFAHAAQAPLLRLPYTKQALSDRLGKTGCAIAAVTDPGLAKAFVSALAQADPEQYSNTAAELAALPETDGYQKELSRMLRVSVRNNTGEGHDREWKNGGMGMEIMQVEGSTAYALLTNIGGEFEPGDRILFHMSHHDQNVDLFEIPVPAQLEQELVIGLNAEVGPDDHYCWQTATISPISFQLDGTYGTGKTANEAVSITLKDGTSFALSSVENGYEDSPYGTYGSLDHSGTGHWEDNKVKSTWLFSQLIDLDELASITVDGVTYPVG